MSGGLARYLAKRIIGMLLVVWAVTLFTFVLMHTVPGGPFVFDKRKRSGGQAAAGRVRQRSWGAKQRSEGIG